MRLWLQSEVADVTWDDATMTLELHPPFVEYSPLRTQHTL